MAQDTVDATIRCRSVDKVPTIEALNSELSGCAQSKVTGRKVLKSLINRLRLRRSASAEISKPDPTYKVAYLGNVVTGWAKGDGCVEKPLATLWRNYIQSSRPDVRMQLCVSGGGLKATTKDHGLTEYWAHRLTCCAAPPHFPRLFCWVYRHEGRRLRHELRCHAVLCSSSAIARELEQQLKHSLALALAEFKKDKISRQNARLSLVNSVYENPTIPRRKILLSTGSHNYRPPLERSKSAPKLTMIEENLEEEEDFFEGRPSNFTGPLFLRHDSVGCLLSNMKRERQNSVPEEKFNKSKVEERVPVILHAVDVISINNSTDLGENCDDDEEEESEVTVIEACNVNGWFRNLVESQDVTPGDSDDGSLSSGCESASTVTSDLDQPPFSTILEDDEEGMETNEELNNNKESSIAKKTELDFKVGGCVLNRFERLSNRDIRKFCSGLKTLTNSNNNNNNNNVLESDEVSLVPLGESEADFSSLKVFKKRSNSEPGVVTLLNFEKSEYNEDDAEENESACSDESGYDEVIDCASSVGNIVLV